MGLVDDYRNEVEKWIREIPTTEWCFSPTDLEFFLFSYPEAQSIFKGKIPKVGYARAIGWAALSHNKQFPYESWTPKNFFDPNLLRLLSLIEILDIRRRYHAQNYFTGSSGGVQIPIHEQWQSLSPIVQELKGEVARIQIPHKKRLNNRGALGKIPALNPWSPMVNINRL